MGVPNSIGSIKSAEKYLGQSTVAGLPDPTTVPAGGYYEMIDPGPAYGTTWAIGDKAISNGTTWAKKVVGVLPKAAGGTGANDEAGASEELDYWRRSKVIDMVASRLPGQFILVRGSGNLITINDNPLLEFGDGSTDKGFAVYVEAAFVVLGGTDPIMVKATASAPNNEWSLEKTNADKLRFDLYDEGTANYLRVEVTAPVVAETFYRILAVYDGSGSASGLKIYVNGILVPQTTSSGGTYVAMHATSADVVVGKKGSVTGNIAVAEWAVYDLELTATDAAKVGSRGGVALENQWGDDSELVTNGGFENWTGSVPDDWTVGSNNTVAEETVDVYAGSSALDLTPGGESTSTANNHFRTQVNILDLSKTQKADLVVKNKSAGTLEISFGYYSVATFDGTTLTPTPEEFGSIYTASQVLGTRLTDLGSGWSRIELWFRVNQQSSTYLTLAGGGQWLVDSVSVKNRGARLYCSAFNTVGNRCVDASLNKLDATRTGTGLNQIPAGRWVHSPSDAATDVLEQITAGSAAALILQRLGTGLHRGVQARQVASGKGYEQIVEVSLAVDATAVVGDLLLGNDKGWADVIQSSGTAQGWAKLVFEGDAADPAILEDRHTLWSVTKDTGSKINVYRDAGASNVLTIQNKTAATIQLTIRLLGTQLA